MKNFLPKQYENDKNYHIKHNYLSEQFFDYKNILKKIEKVIRDNDFTLGREVDKFENNIKLMQKTLGLENFNRELKKRYEELTFTEETFQIAPFGEGNW